MVTKPTGRPRGRPKIALRHDSERYLIAFYEHFGLFSDRSRRETALALVATYYGKLLNTTDNINAFRELSAPITFVASKHMGTTDLRAATQREKSVLHVIADNFARKVRAIVAGFSDGDTDDRRWLAAMVRAWREARGSPALKVPVNVHFSGRT